MIKVTKKRENEQYNNLYDELILKEATSQESPDDFHQKPKAVVMESTYRTCYRMYNRLSAPLPHLRPVANGQWLKKIIEPQNYYQWRILERHNFELVFSIRPMWMDLKKSKDSFMFETL